jgi:hypothetical protein
MSYVADHPLDIPEIQDILQGYLPKYVHDFLKTPFHEPSKDPKKYSDFLADALEFRDYNNVFWLMSELYPGVDPFIVFSPRKSAENGILPAVKWLFTVQSSCNGLMLSLALENEQYEVCEWLISKGVFWILNDIEYIERRNIVRMMATFEFDEDDYNDFAYFGMVNFLKYVHSIGAIVNKEVVCDAAAQGGHIKCLEFLVETGFPLHVQISGLSAVRAGSLLCLKFIHEKGYVMDELTCASAAAAGSLECLEYARCANCPWDYRVFEFASDALHEAHPRDDINDDIRKCIQYAIDNGCPE